MSTTVNEEEEAAQALEATGNYRVLRRIPTWIDSDPAEGAKGIKIGLMIDVETTGLDYRTDQIIELGAVMFNYDAAGRIYRLSEPLHCYNDPGVPITAEITELTGITNEMVAGHKLDVTELDEMIGLSNFVVAFNADFDRKFIERVNMGAVKKPWGCLMAQVPWGAEGIAGRRMEYIAHALGFFYEAHRAVDDCLAGIHLLSRTLPRSGKPVLSALREQAIKPSHRVVIVGKTFDFNHLLKARGYRFRDVTGKPKAWYRDLDAAEAIEPEKAWLTATVKAPIDITTEQITIYDRFSTRAE